METIERIEQLLLDAGVHRRQIRRELSQLCGISVQSVREWFVGSTRRISPEYLALIAKRYGTTTDYLITGREPNLSNLKSTAKSVDDLKSQLRRSFERLSPSDQAELVTEMMLQLRLNIDKDKEQN